MTGTTDDVDPITLEIFRNRADSITEEMFTSLKRTAYSTNIKVREDYSVGAYDANSNMISQAGVTAVHPGTMRFCVRRVLEEFDRSEINEGDTFVFNTPYPVGPHHMNDVTLVTPMMVEGEIFAFLASQAHHEDVGGTESGSQPFGVTEIYQEALQIPPVKLFSEGELVKDVLKIIKQNVRIPKNTEGDIYAQLAAANTGFKRLEELIDEFGRESTETLVAAVMDYAEERMRTRIDEVLPNGTYEFEDFVEGDSIDDDLIRIHASVTVEDDTVVIDFSESDDQVRGPMNVRPPAIIATSHYVIQSVADPEIPTNEGTIRPIDVRTREGSLLEPEYPRPVCNGVAVVGQRVADVLFGALKDAAPKRVMAACSGTMNLTNIGGVSEKTDGHFNYLETFAGGQGAMYDHDGMDAIQTHLTNSRNAPAEVLETTYPFVIEEYALVENSEGAGEYRGGMGLRRKIRLEIDEVSVTFNGDRQEIRPWGNDGGGKASPATFRVVPPDGEDEETYPAKFSTSLEDCVGTTLISRTSGGGGWGDPRDREVEAVLADVRAGLISRDRARDVYGVAITDDLEVDDAETARLRTEG